MSKYLLLLCFCSFMAQGLSGQTTVSNKLKIASIGFYNLENLYDTDNDTLIDDEEFLPEGLRAWTPERYKEKLSNMAYAISQIGIDDVPGGLSVLGVSEVENRRVMQDLTKDPALKARNYKIVHFDSPDKRGVDVGLLYNPTHFTPLHASALPLMIYRDGSRVFTRDILYVKGLIDDDTLHIMVNHWPSRRGGEARTEPFRNEAAKVCRKVIDSLLAVNIESKVIVMGDLNDDPTNVSMKSYLRCVDNVGDVKKTGVFNPFEDMHRRGQGSLAYQDAWSLFDQIVITRGLVNKEKTGYTFMKAKIFNKQFLIQSSGQYKGYGFRTFSGETYQGGYSDHFPTYIYLSKKL